MSKHIQRSPIRRLPRHEDDIYKEIKSEDQRGPSTPEISICPADSPPLSLEIDSYTGLPKLPIELPSPASSPDVERRDLILQAAQDHYRVLGSSLKMSNSTDGGGATSPQRKSVSFAEPEEKMQSSGSGKHRVSLAAFLVLVG